MSPTAARRQLWSPYDLADFLGISPRTLRSWREHQRGPEFVRFSDRVIRYEKAAVKRWLEQRRETRSAQREISEEIHA